MEAKHTPGPWFVLQYSNGYEQRETVQHRDQPLTRPGFCFNTEVGHGQEEADRRNAAAAKATQ